MSSDNLAAAAPCGCPLCSSPFIAGRRPDAVEPCAEPISRRRLHVAALAAREAAFSSDTPVLASVADKTPAELYAGMIDGRR